MHIRSMGIQPIYAHRELDQRSNQAPVPTIGVKGAPTSQRPMGTAGTREAPSPVEMLKATIERIQKQLELLQEALSAAILEQTRTGVPNPQVPAIMNEISVLTGMLLESMKLLEKLEGGGKGSGKGGTPA